MKVLLLFSCMFIGSVGNGMAQNLQKYRLKEGEIVVKAIPEKERYSYENFKIGKILFTNGKSSTAPLNYNLLYGEMEFISEDGDTLSLAQEPLIQNIMIGDDLYYVDNRKGYLKVKTDYPSLKLAAKEKLMLIQKEREFFVNPENDHFRKLSDDEMSKKNFPNNVPVTYQEFYTKPLEGDLLLAKVVGYYFIDFNDRFHPAKKAKVLKIFPGKKRAIRNFIKENNINFHLEEDLEKLVEFCHQLNYQ